MLRPKQPSPLAHLASALGGVESGVDCGKARAHLIAQVAQRLRASKLPEGSLRQGAGEGCVLILVGGYNNTAGRLPIRLKISSQHLKCPLTAIFGLKLAV
jgi:hypothetical protein